MQSQTQLSLIQKVRLSLRVSAVVLYFLSGAIFALYFIVRRALSRGSYSPSGVTHLWAVGFCKVMGLRIHRYGEPTTATCMMVSNHVSWIDIAVFAASTRVHFLSKIEVRSWPLIGWLAEVAGTLFIKRGGNNAGSVIDDLRNFMQEGNSILMFPEGTTTQGLTVRRFHSKLFIAAIQAGVPVQPMTILYECDGTLNYDAAFVGDDDMLSHLIRYLRRPGGRVHLMAHSAIPTYPDSSTAEITRLASAAVNAGHAQLIAGLEKPPGPPPEIIKGKRGRFQ
ncbi:lysophospholipid acyltransferase family protein [Allohahella marinimesophila]|uniref:Lyso-ornithine lipid O-acyltransferase n=1 Tax=Allohahella marinimesophila TaxID=1054972 RepID=A0ABP7Q413_9GAMM